MEIFRRTEEFLRRKKDTLLGLDDVDKIELSSREDKYKTNLNNAVEDAKRVRPIVILGTAAGVGGLIISGRAEALIFVTWGPVLGMGAELLVGLAETRYMNVRKKREQLLS